MDYKDGCLRADRDKEWAELQKNTGVLSLGLPCVLSQTPELGSISCCIAGPHSKHYKGIVHLQNTAWTEITDLPWYESKDYRGAALVQVYGQWVKSIAFIG